MAQKDIFSRLKRLFSTNTIVRNIGGRKLKIVDTGHIQSVAHNGLVDRFQKLYSNMKKYGYNELVQVQQLRLGLFGDYESMDSDAIIASALDIYSDESTMKNEYGKVLNIETDNANIHDILHNLFYDVLNIEFNLWPWVRNMTKYGDFFLKLEINEKYGVTNVMPLSPYDVTRLEGHDPENPNLVQFEFIPQQTSGMVGARHTLRGAEATVLDNYEIAHFRLLSDSSFVPYGRSILEGGRKVWKQLTLMEDAMLIHRIMRAPEKRVFKLDIGNIPPAEVDNYMQQVINKMKKAPVIDEDTGDYNLKYNIQNLTEDFFLPVRGGDSGTEINALPGLTYEATEDIEYLKNKLLASLHVPKAFLGYEEGLGSKATLAAEDVRFARTIERIQRILTSELTKIAVVHLYAQGFRDQELVNFNLNLTNPSTIYEQEKVELWSSKTALAESMIRDGILSTEWIYKNIFNFSDADIKDLDEQIAMDYKNKFRRAQIENEGNDPAKSGEAVGTPSDMAGQGGGGPFGGGGEESSPEDDAKAREESPMGSLFDKGGSEKGGQPGAGRPKEVTKYSKDGSARGRDPLGAHDKKVAYGTGSARKYESLLKNMGSKEKELLEESDEVSEVYKGELNSLNSNKS
tara:strand:- start:1228 stop:3117 length:1890 start_codon:yes stop_codon:yes gene_type:complete